MFSQPFNFSLNDDPQSYFNHSENATDFFYLRMGKNLIESCPDIEFLLREFLIYNLAGSNHTMHVAQKVSDAFLTKVCKN